MSDCALCESAVPTAQPDADENYRQLLAWAEERHREDHIPAQIFNSMRAIGWSRDDAVRALLEALPDALHDEVRLLARPAPEPDFSACPGNSVTIDGHTVQVLCEMRDPRLVVFGHLLSAQECQALIEAARSRLQRSTVSPDGSESQLSDVRTSWGMFLPRGETPLLARIEARIAALLRWPARCAENMQVLRYGQHQEYKPHHDYFPPQDPWAPVFRRGGQRVASLVIYLDTPARGGSTVFPEVPIEVRAVAGNAVFFAYETPDASSRTLHGGAPVTEGEKWVAVKWFRQGTCV